jgi:ribosomal protein S1
LNFKSEYCVKVIEYPHNVEGIHEPLIERFFVGDKVTIYKEGVCAFTGTITLITVKGIYLDAGSKKDKYFRLDEISKIY